MGPAGALRALRVVSALLMALRATSSGGISVNSSYPRSPDRLVSGLHQRIAGDDALDHEDEGVPGVLGNEPQGVRDKDPSRSVTVHDPGLDHGVVHAPGHGVGLLDLGYLVPGLTPPGSISIWTIETGERFRSDMPPGKLPALTAEATVSARSSSDEASFV